MSFLKKSFERKVKLTFSTTARMANYVKPIINRLLLDNDDGDAYRYFVLSWKDSPRPPLASYRGIASSYRVDGPFQKTKLGKFLPLGGLILSPSVTAHLNPIEAEELDTHIKIAVERTITAWIAGHGLYDLPPVSEEIDLHKANREAMEIIAHWEAQESQNNPSNLIDEKGANDA